ncbi:MAG: oxygenase MpaB family protein [Candidatus Dormibacteria bacterium]
MSVAPAPSGPGLLEVLADSFVRSVPTEPADDGLFGPASVTWRVHTSLGGPVAAIRSLMLQSLHPLAMAGVAQHSGWQQDPLGRMAATSGYVNGVTFGERASAERLAAAVRRVHTRVHGVDDVTGLAYSAEDPALLLWVHAAIVDSYLAVAAALGTPLPPATANAYVAEMVAFAELVGVPRDQVPADVAALSAYIEATRPHLRSSASSTEAIDILLSPRDVDPDLTALWSDLGDAATATLPPWAQAMHGRHAEPITAARREAVRQLLGVLDFSFETNPGVLEAKERIELRMRAAARR